MEQKNKKWIYADINAVGEKAENIHALVDEYQNQGADGYYIYDFSKEEAVRERFFHMVRDAFRGIDLPFIIGIYAARFEDVKKALYTGASKVILHSAGSFEAKKEAISRFGGEKVGVELDYSKGDCTEENLGTLWDEGVRMLMVKHVELGTVPKEKLTKYQFDLMVRDSLLRNDLAELFDSDRVGIVATNFYQGKDIRRIKLVLKEQGYEMELPVSRIPFAEFKKEADGLVPVIAQDYQTNEVLMLAYMNEEAYNKTIETGRMTYFSRSRNELWCKGDTSGHYQFVKQLSIDCDRDTILAKVRQVGAACHTGNRSCFYTELAVEENGTSAKNGTEADGKDGATGSLTVLQEVYRTILDRKVHPKEGSYTNYLFEKGIDKILKKCGEESAEIIIAAKNPDAMELKYEVADYLYHLMVLMVETGLSWEEIMEELANRH